MKKRQITQLNNHLQIQTESLESEIVARQLAESVASKLKNELFKYIQANGDAAQLKQERRNLRKDLDGLKAQTATLKHAVDDYEGMKIKLEGDVANLMEKKAAADAAGAGPGAW